MKYEKDNSPVQMKPLRVLKLTAAIWLLALLALLAPLSVLAQSVFQAHLLTPPGGARLSMGQFWFRVDQGEVEFVAIVFPFGNVSALTSNLSPVLSVPGRSVKFALNEGAFTAFHGLYTYADRNPFLPFEPPFVYDEDGNAYLIDAPVIRWGYLYTGRFALPAGFERQLLNGHGTVQFNEYLSGLVTVEVATAPGKRRR